MTCANREMLVDKSNPDKSNGEVHVFYRELHKESHIEGSNIYREYSTKGIVPTTLFDSKISIIANNQVSGIRLNQTSTN